ncbi:MAG: hypothetical protein NTW38_02445 [Candidatus Aminicenantes bacterium]|nr:hypothetical protein [Candidatus Aminicenantes bacterium]
MNRKKISRFLNQTRSVKPVKNAFDVAGGVSGHSRKEYRLSVKTSGSLTLTYDSLKGKFVEKTVEIK